EMLLRGLLRGNLTQILCFPRDFVALTTGELSSNCELPAVSSRHGQTQIPAVKGPVWPDGRGFPCRTLGRMKTGFSGERSRPGRPAARSGFDPTRRQRYFAGAADSCGRRRHAATCFRSLSPRSNDSVTSTARPLLDY